MNLPWAPVVYVDNIGSILMLAVSVWCLVLARRLANEKPDDVFRSYLFLFTLAIVFFAVSRSFGHLVKQQLLHHGHAEAWALIAPFSGAVNSTTFVVIFAFGLYFHRAQKVQAEIEKYRYNLEEMIAVRTEELEQSKNVLENILNNSIPINITTVNFDLAQANEAYYENWPRHIDDRQPVKCYMSRPGAHCHTDNCPLKLIVAGHEEVVQEVVKDIRGESREFIVTARPFRDLDGTLLGMVESFLEITLRKRAERALRESEERFRLVFESNPDPVILTKLVDGEILDVNDAFELATGLSRVEALRHNSEELGLWAEKGVREEFREALVANGEVNNFEAEFRVVDGRIRTGLLSARVLTLGEERCVLLVIRDITTEKAAERVLVEMDRMKGEFISTAAHELNTPLSAIMGYSELLLDVDGFGNFSEEQKGDFVREIYENSEALSRIIGDLLDISRIESGKPIPLVLQETDFVEVLRKKMESFRARNGAHLLRLELPDEPERAVFRFDCHRINQALENLLSNAVKYSCKGSEIVLAGKEVAGGCWEVRVSDQGIGMTPEQVGRVFDKFYRADASNTAISGLGLGMSIVKQSIEAHGGRIRVESAPGKGTTVIFTLPYEVPEAKL